MVSYSSYSPLGASIETGEITTGAVTYAKLGNDLFKLVLLETLSDTAKATVTSSALTAYDNYVIVIRHLVATSIIDMRVNGHTGTDYNYTWINNNSLTSSTGQTFWKITQTLANQKVCGILFLSGLATPDANSHITVRSLLSCTPGANTVLFLNGSVDLRGSAGTPEQVSTITFFTEDTGADMDYEIDIYGVE